MYTFPSLAIDLGDGAPAPTLTLGRYFYVASLGHCYSVLHPPTHTAGGARLMAQALLLHVTAWPDALSLQLDRAQLTPAWTGTYRVSELGQPPTVVAAYGYGQWLDEAPQLLTTPSSPVLGSLTITAYDARQRRISGHFELGAAEHSTPVGLAGGGAQLCSLRLAGEFNNLLVMGR